MSLFKDCLVMRWIRSRCRHAFDQQMGAKVVYTSNGQFFHVLLVVQRSTKAGVLCDKYYLVEENWIF